jgi:hypothetical protein
MSSDAGGLCKAIHVTTRRWKSASCRSIERRSLLKNSWKSSFSVFYQYFTAQHESFTGNETSAILSALHGGEIGREYMEKVGGLAAGLAVVLAIVGGFVSIPGLEVGLIILVLGIIGGIAADQDGAIRMYLAVLVLPAVGAVLGAIPAIGEYLTAIFSNLAVAAAGMSASLITRRLYDMVMGALKGLSSGSDS